MPKYRNKLPQLANRDFLTDGGLETWMVFQEGLDLPAFAAFTLLNSEKGRAALDRYMMNFGRIAVRHKLGFIMDTPTWRASSRWANDLGVSIRDLKEIHKQAMMYLLSLREGLETDTSPFVLNGVLGPQDDGYNPRRLMTVSEARDYHARQIDWFFEYAADMVSAITMTYVEEALGIALAAKRRGMPSAISFTLETDGRLPSGQGLGDAICQVDLETGEAPAYYMINCAHPDHFVDVLKGGGDWVQRIGGVRANASRLSHEELDNAEELDAGNPEELASQYLELRQLLPKATVLGGCCGTDHRHVGAIAETCACCHAH
ncbi:homocysteine S-methyltransferase family protein [uncultured Roseibium sp.]|uniref:homocysteine S-methyltransferase family protein n=1 Tax=uncultured Roseibium sp. TaxID=1936171 RepID=UPI00260782B8|nr:homocysteine S-methyltransferase family protein [uncultured Roseibium sp.]